MYLLKELNNFLDRASLATYGGGGSEMTSQRPDFTNLNLKKVHENTGTAMVDFSSLGYRKWFGSIGDFS